MTISSVVPRPFWLLLGVIALGISGCGGGGASQEELMRAAMRTSGDEDEEEESGNGNQNTANLQSANNDSDTTDPANPVVGENTNAGEANLTQSGTGSEAGSPTGPNPDANSTGSTGSTNANNTGTGNGLADTDNPSSNSDSSNQADGPGETVESSAYVTTNSLVERRARSIENMEKIAKGILSYMADKKALPPTTMYDAEGRALLSWRVRLLPYLGYRDLYEEFRLNEPWDSSHNQALLVKIPDCFIDPQRGDHKTCYVLPVGSSTAFPGGRRNILTMRVEDGIENTIVLLEGDDSIATPWTQPSDLPIDRNNAFNQLGGRYPDGFFVAYGDGVVRKIVSAATPNDFYGMLTIDSGEAISVQRVTELAEAQIESVASTPTEVPVEPVVETLPVERNLSDDFRELSYASLATGKEYRAYQEQYVSILLDDPANAARQYSYSASLQRPVLALRWGVGVDAAIPDGVRNGPDPIVNEDRIDRWREGHPGERGMEYYTGELGLRLLTMLRGMQDQGKFGVFASTGVLDENTARPRRRGGGTRDLDPERHYPGIHILGLGSRRVQTHVGRRYSVDVVVMFDVDIKATRYNQVHNTTTIRLLDGESGQTIYESRSLNNLRVERDREDRLREDPVIEIFERLEEVILDELAVDALPSMDPETVATRVAQMKRNIPHNPLPMLAELQLYYGLGLVSQYEFREHCVAITENEEAAVIVDGTDREKRDFLERYVDDGPED